MVVLIILGRATLWMAIVTDVGAMLLVTFNGMRILNRFGSTENKAPASTPVPTRDVVAAVELKALDLELGHDHKHAHKHEHKHEHKHGTGDCCSHTHTTSTHGNVDV
jgi:hypothetical protein